MRKITFLIPPVGLAVAVALSNAVQAESLNVNASVAVDNSIHFMLNGKMDFGIVRANADQNSGTCSGVTMHADPSSSMSSDLGESGSSTCGSGQGESVLENVGGAPSRPEFSISGVAPFAQLNLELPEEPVDLKVTPSPAGAPKFQLHDFTAYQTNGTQGEITDTVTADEQGNAEFAVGASLITDPDGPTLPYQNTNYTGNFDVTVSY